MKQLIEAVEFIHSKNIVHRDLKVFFFLNYFFCGSCFLGLFFLKTFLVFIKYGNGHFALLNLIVNWCSNIFLQPENILLDDNLNVKVSDFGFATVLGEDDELTGKIPISYIKYKTLKSTGHMWFISPLFSEIIIWCMYMYYKW